MCGKTETGRAAIGDVCAQATHSTDSTEISAIFDSLKFKKGCFFFTFTPASKFTFLYISLCSKALTWVFLIQALNQRLFIL